MSPTIPASPSGTLILQDHEGVSVQYSLKGIDATFYSGWGDDNRVDLSARLGGENFVDLAPKIKTVADLSLGMLHKTRVRVTTKKGIHEGVLHGIATDTDVTDLRARKLYRTYTELEIGDARVPVETSDLAEVIEEETA